MKAYIDNADIKFHKFVTVHIYSGFINKCPKIKHVGDIIRLRRFNFVLTERGELVGYCNMYSNWLIYSGKKGSKYSATSHKDIEKNVNRALTTFEKQKLNELRDWGHDFFRSNAIRSITWSSDLREPADENAAAKDKYTSQKVDLVLKTSKVLKKKKAVEFIDHNGKKYALFLQAPPVLSTGDVIKLRCVNVIFTDDGRIITLTDNSSCLLVPDHFFDAQLFNRSANVTPTKSNYSRTPGKSGKATPLNNKRQATATYPFLAEYNFEEHLIAKSGNKRSKLQNQQVTMIKKAYDHKIPTPISDLFDILENPKDYEHQRFVISGYILGFSETELSKIVKKMDTSTKKVYMFNEDAGNKKLQHIYHFILFMKDQSIEGTDKLLNTYVLTNEGDQNLFDLWNILPSPNQTAAWENLGPAEINQFEGKFKNLKNLENKVKLVVELLITNTGKPFFKLYDTVFLP
eukprot:TRINITY_DN11560_c0_g1_i1.p1 TRINITY_DN11560_c0_g1~~TRINITY_DN11560_c0_g1_i1.p1  ORF type:complete len:524 (+),score=121.67 TRINITY_DN11560_c0_g1_i1:195-1574(+)